jgi:hypothetical protein
MALGRMITGFITVIVGASLVPTLVTVINSAISDLNTTGTQGSAASLLELTILFFALGVMIAGVGTSVSGLVEYGLV